MTGVSRRAAGVALMAVTARPGAPVRAQQPDWSREAQRRLQAGADPERRRALAESDALVAFAEQRLAEGEALAARDALERAALLAHTAEIELGLVRAQMQEGEYRRAVAFCAHAAGAHPELPEGLLLYAWLLRAGGQDRYADRVLAEAQERRSGQPALQAVRERLAQGWPALPSALQSGLARACPYAWGEALPAATRARAGATALVTDDGRGAITPLSALADVRPLALRNGLGQTVRAEVADRDPASGLALLRTDAPLAPPAPLQRVAREPYAGSVGTCVEYAPQADASLPAWPWLRQGFIGRFVDGAARPLGLALPPGPRGGPVFDAAGCLAGLAVPAPDGRDALVSVPHWPAAWLERVAPQTGSARSAAVAVEAVYEVALKRSAQLIVAPG